MENQLKSRIAWGKTPKWFRVLLIFPLLCLNSFLLLKVIDYLQPFFSFLVIASIIAFLIELVVNLLVEKGLNRALSIAIVVLLTLFIIAVSSLIVIPLLIQQLNDLIASIPGWIKHGRDYLLSLSDLPFFQRFPINFDAIIQDITNRISSIIQFLGSQTFNIVFATINRVFDVLFIAILIVFLLIGGDKFWEGIYSFLPPPWDEKVPFYFRETFKDYFFIRLIIIGLASLLRLFVFVLIGIPSALFFAFIIGLASLIPFFGAVVMVLSSIILLFKSIKLAIFFLVAATIIEQITENLIAPRLMGELIGLNPIWVIISLFLGAKISGVLGVFLAVPTASVIKRIVEDMRGLGEGGIGMGGDRE